MSDPEDVIAEKLLDEGFGHWVDHVDAAEVAVAALTAAGFAVVPQADVDAAARLRAEMALLNNGIDAIRQCWHADESPRWTANVIEALRHSGLIDDAWAAAAVGSVDPEGGNPKLAVDYMTPEREALADRMAESATPIVVPARPSVCPTCDSDEPEIRWCPNCNRGGALGECSECPDPWHSPDRGQR